MIEYYIAIGLISLFSTFILTKYLIPRLKNANLIGKDVNKEDKPEVAEMGGIAIVAGFSTGIMLAIFFNSFMAFEFNLIYVLAALITIHTVAFIGISDDLIDIPQWLKAILPLAAAIPLVAVKAVGSTTLMIPFLGAVDFGIFYILLLIPIGIAVCSNLTNMFAGFNGMESSMGIVIFATMAVLGLGKGSTEMTLMAIAILGALIGFLFFNKYPSKVFPGDVGNLTIGAALASMVIIGNFETAGTILIIPYVVDFFVKLYNRFPSSKWWGEIKDGKLYPVEGKVRGLAQLIMKKTNGISEGNLVLLFVGVEIVLAVIVLVVYL